MRHRFAHEDIDTIIGHHFDVGAIQFEDREYPVSWSNSFMVEDLIGTAKDLRREDDGTLTAEIVWTNEKGEQASALIEDKSCWLTIYGDQVVRKGDPREYPSSPGDSQVEVKSLRLKALFVTHTPEDPWTEGAYRTPKSHAANPDAMVDRPEADD